MDREELDTWLNRGIIGTVLAMLVAGPLAMGAVVQRHFLILQGLAILLLVLWSVRLWVKPKARLLWPPLCWVAIATLTYVGIRYATADIEYIARLEWIKFLIYGLVFFVVVNNFYRQEAVQAVTFTLICLGFGLSVYAALQFLTGSDQVWTVTKPVQYHGRGSGTYICPNHLAGFLEMVLPIGIAYALGGRLGHVWRICLVYALAVILVGLAATLSRAGWVAAALSLIVLLLVYVRRPGYRIPAIAALVCLTAAGVWFASKGGFLLQQRVERMLDYGATQNMRFQLWPAAWGMWQDHPWLGVGPAHFNFRFPQYRPEAIQGQPDRVHNDFLNTLTDHGLLGFALLALALGIFTQGLFKIWKAVRRESDDFGAKRSNRSAFVLGGAVALVAIFIHSWADFNMHIPANALVAMVLVALLATHWRHVSDRYWLRLNGFAKALLTLVLLAAAAYLGKEGVRRMQEMAALRQADNADPGSGDAIDALKRAHAIEPKNSQTVHDIGEYYRSLSFLGRADYKEPAREAIAWHEKALALNPYAYRSHIRIGMCLDWIEDHVKAESHFEKAKELDPNGYFTTAYLGWHDFQVKNYEEAHRHFKRSLALKSRNNRVAEVYLERLKQLHAKGNE